jgi:hypothetical protein
MQKKMLLDGMESQYWQKCQKLAKMPKTAIMAYKFTISYIPQLYKNFIKY